MRAGPYRWLVLFAAICTALVVTAMWAATPIYAGAYGEKFAIVCNPISTGYCNEGDFRGIKATVGLAYNYDNADEPSDGVVIADIRLERRGGGGMIQAGPAFLWDFQGARGCDGDSGARILVERKKPGVWWRPWTLGKYGAYRCTLYDHPTGDVEDYVDMKITSTTDPSDGDTTFYIFRGGTQIHETTAAYDGSGAAMAMTGFIHNGSRDPDIILGYYKDLRITKTSGEGGWRKTTAYGKTFGRCFPGPPAGTDQECTFDGLLSAIRGDTADAPPVRGFVLRWME